MWRVVSPWLPRDTLGGRFPNVSLTLSPSSSPSSWAALKSKVFSVSTGPKTSDSGTPE